MNERQTKIANRAEKLQEDLQSIINVGKKVKDSKADYIDFVTAFFMHRISALEIETEELIEKAFAVGHTIGYGNTENHYKPEFERWWNDENTQE